MAGERVGGFALPLLTARDLRIVMIPVPETDQRRIFRLGTFRCLARKRVEGIDAASRGTVPGLW